MGGETFSPPPPASERSPRPFRASVALCSATYAQCGQGPSNGPRSLQDGPQCPRDSLRTLQAAPRALPEHLQESPKKRISSTSHKLCQSFAFSFVRASDSPTSPRDSQYRPKTAQEAPRRAPERSKKAPRSPKRPPKIAPRGPQERPKMRSRGKGESALRAIPPKSATETTSRSTRRPPKRPPRPLRRSQEASQRPPRGPRMTPPQEAPTVL